MGTWRWLGDLEHTSAQLLLRDGSVLRVTSSGGPWQVLRPHVGDSYASFSVQYVDPPAPGGGGELMVLHTGAVMALGSGIWTWDMGLGLWWPARMPDGVVRAGEFLVGPHAELYDGRVAFQIVSGPFDPTGDFQLVGLLTVTESGVWQRHELDSPLWIAGLVGGPVMFPERRGHLLVGVWEAELGQYSMLDFNPSNDQWTPGPWAPPDTGGAPAFVLPDRTVLVVGGQALYRYTPGAAEPWEQLAPLPALDPVGIPLLAALGGVAVLLPSGRVLVGAIHSDTNDFADTTRLSLMMYEYDIARNEFLPADPHLTDLNHTPTDIRFESYSLLLLPTGEVLMSVLGHGLMLYTPDPVPPHDEWRPVIVTCPDTVDADTTFRLSGRGFGGISQAVAGTTYRTTAVPATNYPLVRVTHREGWGQPAYWRSSSLGPHPIDGTGDEPIDVFVPHHAGPARYYLTVTVNGIESQPVRLDVRAQSQQAQSQQRFATTPFGRQVFGNLADGDPFVLTGHGPQRVPGWDTGQRDKIKTLNDDLRRVTAELFTLGQQLPRLRQTRKDTD